MEGIKHVIIIAVLCVGLFIGGVLPDLDHRGTLKDKWSEFWRFDGVQKTERGFLHTVQGYMVSMYFFAMIIVGLTVHYILDRI